MKRLLASGILAVLLWLPWEGAFGLVVPAEGLVVPDPCAEFSQHLAGLACPQAGCLTFKATFFRVKKEGTGEKHCLLVSEKPFSRERIVFNHEILSMTDEPNSGRYFADINTDLNRDKSFAYLIEDEEKFKTFTRFFYNDHISDGQPLDALLFQFNVPAAENRFWQPEDFQALGLGVVKMSPDEILEEWNERENLAEAGIGGAEGEDFDPNADIKAQGEAGQPAAEPQLKTGGGCSLIFEENWKPFSLLFLLLLIPVLLFPRRRLQKKRAVILPFRKKPPWR